MSSSARLAPLALQDVPDELRGAIEKAAGLMGFAANDVLTMARWPELLSAMAQLVQVIYVPGTIDAGLKRLVALLASAGAGCRYCQAHTAHGSAAFAGLSAEKIDAAWTFETSDLFTTAERSALRVAFAAGQTPSAVTDADFADLKSHFSERQIIEIMGVISLFGFLNRWNDTLATELESKPLAFARSALSPDHWQPGHHA